MFLLKFSKVNNVRKTGLERKARGCGREDLRGGPPRAPTHPTFPSPKCQFHLKLKDNNYVALVYWLCKKTEKLNHFPCEYIHLSFFFFF